MQNFPSVKVSILYYMHIYYISILWSETAYLISTGQDRKTRRQEGSTSKTSKNDSHRQKNICIKKVRVWGSTTTLQHDYNR